MTADDEAVSSVPGRAPAVNEVSCIFSMAETKASLRLRNRPISCRSAFSEVTVRMPITVSTSRLPRSAPLSRITRVSAVSFLW